MKRQASTVFGNRNRNSDCQGHKIYMNSNPTKYHARMSWPVAPSSESTTPTTAKTKGMATASEEYERWIQSAVRTSANEPVRSPTFGFTRDNTSVSLAKPTSGYLQS